MIENRHQLDFADTLRRPLAVCLGLPLRPYSLGHELELLRDRNAFVLTRSLAEILKLPAPEIRAALITAVDVCSQSETELREGETLLRGTIHPLNLRRRWQRRQLRGVWRRWQRALLFTNFLTAAETFWQYLCAGKTGPEYASPEPDTPTVPIGAPEMAILIQYVRSLPDTLRAVHGPHELDYPLALARYELATREESAGHVRLKPDGHQSFEDWCAEQEEKLSRGEIRLPATN